MDLLKFSPVTNTVRSKLLFNFKGYVYEKYQFTFFPVNANLKTKVLPFPGCNLKSKRYISGICKVKEKKIEDIQVCFVITINVTSNEKKLPFFLTRKLKNRVQCVHIRCKTEVKN